jgi:hypothetical protein
MRQRASTAWPLWPTRFDGPNQAQKKAKFLNRSLQPD